MNGMLTLLNTFFDRLFTAGVIPLFHLLGQGLAFVLLRPLALLRVPLPGRLLLMGIFFGLLSRQLYRWLRVEEDEHRFQSAFAAKREQRQDLNAITDWKLREALFRAADDELDEAYNTYLAKRFAQHGVVHLLPLFFALAWLDRFLPAPALAGLPTAVPFLAGYLATVLGRHLDGSRLRRALARRRN